MSGAPGKWNWRIPREPDFIIGPHDAPYLRRWWVIPRNRFCNVYLHNMLRDDDDRALHDHPWWNVSIILKGGYLEWLSHRGDPVNCIWRGPWSFVFRKPTCAHRLTTGQGTGPSWSLFITGPIVRQWGFHCPKGWRIWTEFVDARDSGQIGKGCE